VWNDHTLAFGVLLGGVLKSTLTLFVFLYGILISYSLTLLQMFLLIVWLIDSFLTTLFQLLILCIVEWYDEL